MDILHLSDDELDFEIQLRKQDPGSCRTRREKTGKLRAMIEVERESMDIPDTADHIITQAEHVDVCQRKLQLVYDRLIKALKEENSTELAICRSKLLHYRGRVAMIIDREFALYVQKLEDYMETALQRIADFFSSVTLLSPPILKAAGDVPILPDIEVLASRLRNTNVQAVFKEQQQANPRISIATNSPVGNLRLPRLPRESSRNDQEILNEQIPVFMTDNPVPLPRNQIGAQSQHQANNEPIDVRDDVIRYLLQSRPDSSRNQIPQRFRNTQPIHKWPFTYAGEANIMQLAVFLNRVKTYADTEEVDELSLLRGVKHLLKGRALEWYIRSYQNCPSWEHFKKEIKKEFLPQAYSQHMKRELYWRIQGSEEPFIRYYRDILALFEVVEPPLSNQDRFYIIKSNLNPEFAAIASASRAETVEELVNVCKDYDDARTYSHRNRPNQAPRLFGATQASNTPQRSSRPTAVYSWNRSPQNRQQQVNALEEEMHIAYNQEQDAMLEPVRLENQGSSNRHSIVPEVNAIRTNAWQPRPSHHPSNGQPQQLNIICWQCEQRGHTFPNCQNPKTFIFCYKCGKRGTTSRNCPDCIARLAQAIPEASNTPGNARPEFLQ